MFKLCPFLFLICQNVYWKIIRLFWVENFHVFLKVLCFWRIFNSIKEFCIISWDITRSLSNMIIKFLLLMQNHGWPQAGKIVVDLINCGRPDTHRSLFNCTFVNNSHYSQIGSLILSIYFCRFKSFKEMASSIYTQYADTDFHPKIHFNNVLRHHEQHRPMQPLPWGVWWLASHSTIGIRYWHEEQEIDLQPVHNAISIVKVQAGKVRNQLIDAHTLCKVL